MIERRVSYAQPPCCALATAITIVLENVNPIVIICCVVNVVMEVVLQKGCRLLLLT